MKCLIFYILLPAFAAAAVTPPVRAERLNVLSFLNDAFCATTQKAVTAKITANSDPVKQVIVENSDDLSDSKSEENIDTNGFPDTFKDLDSDEVLSREDLAKQQAQLSKMTAESNDNMQLMDMRRLILDHKSQMLKGIQQELQTSSEPIDPDSEEGMKQSREMPDGDSLEEDNGRQAAGGSSKDGGYDDTKEFLSSETYPSKPSSLSVPAKSRAA